METKTQTFSVDTWLPVFSGFYGTIWETDSDEEREMEYINDARAEKGLKPAEWDDVEWDYQDYTNRVSHGVTEDIGDWLIIGGYIHKYAFQKLNSPREYNFANDSIHVSFTLNGDNEQTIRAYLSEYKEAFTKYLKDRYTSYDGFCSSYSNDVYQWLVDADLLKHEHKLGSVLNFIILNEDKDIEMSIYERLKGNGYTLQAKNYAALMEPTI